MRIISYILVVIGILLLTSAGYDEYRGVTHLPTGQAGQYTIISASHEVLTKASDPKEFRSAMTYHWFIASMFLLIGFIAYMVDKGQEKSDPFSRNYAEGKALDDWSDAMKKEEDRRKHPKP